jgi:hypothetical protein
MNEDICTRLLTWTSGNQSSVNDMMDDAAREIVELRNRLAELSVIVRTCRSRSECVKAANRLAPVTVDQQVLNGYHRVELAWREMRPPMLTDEERTCLGYAIGVLEDEDQWHESGVKCIATLRKLLERTK